MRSVTLIAIAITLAGCGDPTTGSTPRQEANRFRRCMALAFRSRPTPLSDSGSIPVSNLGISPTVKCQITAHYQGVTRMKALMAELKISPTGRRTLR